MTDLWPRILTANIKFLLQSKQLGHDFKRGKVEADVDIYMERGGWGWGGGGCVGGRLKHHL